MLYYMTRDVYMSGYGYGTSYGYNITDYESRVNELINKRLAGYNDRNAEKTRQRLETIKSMVERDLGSTIGLRFGGSISRHTYVDGFSDTDILIIIGNTDLSSKSPREILEYIKYKIQITTIADFESISTGQLAVTIRYRDGMELQLVPAIKKTDGYKIPSYKSNEWSEVIRPEKFADKLTEINQSCDGKVIPVIKLAKGIVSRFPEDQQLSGYHMESIAIEVFRNYSKSNQLSIKGMLRYYFEKAKDVVKRPIKDKTGQSIHVDDKLGNENSWERIRVSSSLDNIYNRMKSADDYRQINDWDSLLG